MERTISDEIQIYAQKEYESCLVRALLSKDVSSHISIPIDTMGLFESSIGFAHYIFQNPNRALKLLEDAFQKVALNISHTHSSKSDMIFKENLHIRLIALPNLPEIYRSNLPNCSDVGQFLCISGSVVRASTSKMLQYKKLWRCTKCKHQFIVEAKVEYGYVCEKPLVCQNPEFCKGKNFTMMSTEINTEWCKDYQEIKLQEQVYNLNVGNVPRSMWVILENDLVELCHPGNDVIVSGIVIQQSKPFSRGSLMDIELKILAHNIEVQNKMSSGVVSKDMAEEFGQFWRSYNSNPLSGRNFILSSVSPQVFGLYIVKLAVALVLAGGVQKKSGSSRIRGDSHLLLVGDPGTAKSQFLKFATKVSSRAVLTSGIGTTNAGLTVSAVKEGSRWELEAGALVLADGGICCIDEFGCIKEQDKTCIHEAMEQQTISVAKAGLVCSLNSRCSILASTNPKGRYDENLSISENTALGSPLLSRFDIILVLLDTYDENWDNMVSSYILDGRNIVNKNDALWSVAKMKSYFILIRHINPKVTLDAERVLLAYYTKQRGLQLRNTSRTTPRLLQSLIRLAEGHARLMFRKEVLVVDAIMAISLIESSMLDNSILEGLSPLHTVFPSKPEVEYVERAEKIFHDLNIELPTEANFNHFYDESTIKNLLMDISSVWNSEENPYIFGSSQCNNSNDGFQEISLGSNEITNFDPAFASTSHKRARYSNDNIENAPSVEPVVVEVDTNDVSSTEIFHGKVNNEITTVSGLEKIFDTSETVTSENMQNNSSQSIDNTYVLHQILEEPDFNICHNAVAASSEHNKNVKNIFNEINRTEISKDSRNIGESSSSNSAKICIKSDFKKTMDVEVLESSAEKNSKTSDKIISTNSQYLNNLPCSSFPAKRTLADQLKKFVFSKSNYNSQNFLNKTTASNLCPENEANTNFKDTVNQNHIENKSELKQLMVKKSAFKMIVDKSRKYQSQTSVGNFSGNLLSAPEIARNGQKFDLSCSTSKNNHNTNEIKNNIPEVSELREIDQHFVTDTSVNNSASSEQSETNVPKKKPIPDKYKAFMFSKHKTSKRQ